MNQPFRFLHPFIDNVIELNRNEKYAVIIGANPSKGARSPMLWNLAYEQYQMGIKMYPFDVSRKNLHSLLAYLEDTPEFLGGAIAVPFKEDVAKWLGKRLSSEALNIGAVNCIAKNDKGKLWGYNTDGQASLEVFEKKFAPLSFGSILILGSGGSAKAVSAFFRKAIKSSDSISIASRSLNGRTYAQKIGANWVRWEDVPSLLPNVNILINCTTVGHGDFVNESPLSYEDLLLLPRDSIVYDIIYQPSPSLLLQYALNQNLSILDGTAMNLSQAVIAFCYVNRGKKISKARTELSMLKFISKNI